MLFRSDQALATIAVAASDVRRPAAVDRLTVDLTSGRIVAVSPAAKESGVRSALDWLYLLHSGTAFGVAGYTQAILGLGLLTMPVLGILLWATRRAMRRARVPVRTRL